MGVFWDNATAQAGREFGARHYRWFAAVRAVRLLAPGLVVLAILGGLTAGYLWLSPDWPAIGNRVAGGADAVGPVLLWIGGGVIAAGVLLAVGLWIARNWWRWSLSRPMWMRRY